MCQQTEGKMLNINIPTITSVYLKKLNTFACIWFHLVMCFQISNRAKVAKDNSLV